MDRKTLRIAYYGKGGIGKSTVAANLSAALAKSGKKVLHIGCDPKADSVRPLTGRRIPTALEALNSSGSRPTREQLVFPGIYGISCVEAGGPKAGSGCAGLGITAAMGELERLGVFDEEWDVVAYDVLGDVVCGGFAVPMRKHYADLVYLITSDEYMSLYAANNILKGVAAYSTKTPMLGGIIHNRAADVSGMKLVAEFAERTGARHVAAIPSHHHIRQADYRRAVVSAAFPESDMLPVFSKVSDFLTTHFIGARPQPLSEEALEDLCCSAFPEEERSVYA